VRPDEIQSISTELVADEYCASFRWTVELLSCADRPDAIAKAASSASEMTDADALLSLTPSERDLT
jgi:hypothetical protein